ncbi:hypothetical protein TcCL_ESM07889, partial [Trypanosoma cruzi]
GSIAATSSTTATPFVMHTPSISTVSRARPTVMALSTVPPRSRKGTASTAGIHAAAATSANTKSSTATRRVAAALRRTRCRLCGHAPTADDIHQPKKVPTGLSWCVALASSTVPPAPQIPSYRFQIQ